MKPSPRPSLPPDDSLGCGGSWCAGSGLRPRLDAAGLVVAGDISDRLSRVEGREREEEREEKKRRRNSNADELSPSHTRPFSPR